MIKIKLYLILYFSTTVFFCHAEKKEHESSIFSSVLDVLAYGYVAISEKTSKESKKEAIVNAFSGAQEIVSNVVKNKQNCTKRCFLVNQSFDFHNNVICSFVYKGSTCLIILKTYQPDPTDV